MTGRPKKELIESKTQGKRKLPRGRPKGDAAIINEYKARMLASPKSRAVLETIWDAALNDDHPNQSAAWKLVIDRVMPVSYFEKEKNSNAKAAVSITITGVGGETTVIGGQEEESNEVIDGEYRES